MKKVIKGILGAAIVLIAVLVVFSFFSDSDTPDTAKNGDVQNNAAVETTEQQGDKLVYEDDFMKVWFVGTYEQPDVVPDTCYFTLKVENKSDEQFMVVPSEASADDFMVNVLSGIPLTVDAGKTGQNTFFFSYSGFVDSMAEINSIQFTAKLLDDNTETIHEADIAFDI